MTSQPQYSQAPQPSYTQVPQGNPHTWSPPPASSTYVSPSPSTPAEKPLAHPPVSTPAEKPLAHPPVPTPRRRNVRGPVLALIVTFLITVALVAVVLTRPKLFKTNVYNNLSLNIYTFSLTILATLLASFTRNQLKILWIREADKLLAEEGGAAGWDILNKRWRTTLEVARIHERWSSFANLRIDLTYIVAGLLIPCITAGFSVYQDFRTIHYSPKIPDGHDYFCANVTAAEPPGSTFSWKLDGGNYYTVDTSFVLCPTSEAQTLFGNINNQDPSSFAYADMGVAVLPTALGAPASIYGWVTGRDEGIISLSRKYQLGLFQTTQCVPVMQRNPISCREGGNIQFSDTNNTMYATSADGNCIAYDDFLEINYNPQKDYVMVKQECTGPALGQGTIIMGATGLYASSLANMTNDPSPPPGDPSDTFAVTCTINVNAQTFAYRKVYLDFQYDIGDSSVPFGKVLFGGESCDGPTRYPAGSNARIALAAVSSDSIISEGYGFGGWSQALAEGTLNFNLDGDSFSRQSMARAFPESQNTLEDFLGVAAAMVVSRIYNGDESMIPTDGSASISSWRIGSGSRVALVYAIPPFAVLLILAWKLWSLRGLEVAWKTSRLGDLIAYGRVMSGA